MTRALALLMAICLAGSAWADELGVEDVLARIKHEITRAQQEQTGQPRLLIEKVELELFLKAHTRGEGGLAFSLPVMQVVQGKIVGQLAQSNAQRLNLILRPEDDTFVAAGHDLALASAIKEVKRALQAAINTPPALLLDEFVYDAEFYVIKSGTGGFDFWLLQAEAEMREERANRVIVHMRLASE